MIRIDPLVENLLRSYTNDAKTLEMFIQCLVHCSEHLPDVMFAARDKDDVELSWNPEYEHCQIQTRSLGLIPAIPTESEGSHPAPC